MTTRQIFALWPQSLAKGMRKWLLRRKLAHANYEESYCAHMQRQFRDEQRYWQGQQALIQSDLRML